MLTKATRQAKYHKIALARKLGIKGAPTRILHTVERQMKRAAEPKKEVDRK